VWHAAASDYASLLPMTAMLHSGRVGMKGERQFASQAIEPIGGEARVAEPGRRTAGGRGVRGLASAVLARRLFQASWSAIQ